MKILRVIYWCVILVCPLLILYAGSLKTRQADHNIESMLEEDEENEVAEIAVMQEVSNKPPYKSDDDSEPLSSEAVVLRRYQNLYAVNKDMIGFIYLSDTNRYPIMQRIDDQNHYEGYSFFDEPDKEGAIFANTYAELGEQGISLIYGHNLKSGRMFAILRNYLKEGYFQEHNILRIDTLYEEMGYEVVAVALTSLRDDFQYFAYVGPQTEESFNEWRDGFEKSCRIGSLAELSSSDIIVELSTCYYHVEDGRLVVILRARQ